MQAADSVFDYIVFKGADILDLRVEEFGPPAPAPPADPAIIGVSTIELCWNDEAFRMLNYIILKRKTMWISPLPSF